MDRLSPLDAAFLDAEDADRHTSMAIASIAIFDGPAPPHDELVQALAARLPLVPRYRQRVRRAPFDLAPPAWVDDPDVDLSYHVRRTSLAAPGGDAELYRLMGRLMAQRLDRDRPLWETWVIEGLADGRWAMVSKVHHCMVDGVAGTELYHLLLSPTADPPALPPTDAAAVPTAPSTGEFVVDTATQIALTPWRQLQLVATALRHPDRAAARVAVTVRGLTALASSVKPVAPNSLQGEVGQQRRYDAMVVSLEDVKLVRRHFGVTINDVALAALTGGYRALLLARGEQCKHDSVRSLVPSSVRPPGAEGDLANRVSAMLADLPVHLDDPVHRLRAVHDQLSALKEHKEAEAGEALVALSAYEPFAPLSVLLRAAFRMPQRTIVTVTTNVPGPRIPLYLLGRRMRRLLPFVPIADRVRTGVAMLSYGDEFAFGVTGDYDTGADIGVLLDGTRRDLDALVTAARTTTVARTG